ncbi:class II aldolase/adducin family protein [Novosphingobium sp. 1949]|uniref:Class II aldolase/adducin family protein n=1 Tax=Novosphingobium organovorum TaxID=2930092 RepID=A0ABT0BJ78_9SPHN|nr:class II aldolase/adducin family protein [Novosphingobium organovorum]MCJ2185074.1 class II aldolase/adducin family protein [Novosphingobium organovorum]
MIVSEDPREAIVQVMQALDARGLNRGTSGNVSVRTANGMLVSPSGIVASALLPEQIVAMDGEGTSDANAGRPSSEWRMHLGIYTRRPDVGAIVHCHSRHATTLACANRPIPPIHYMVAVSGGAQVPVAPYATFGTDALADRVVDALDGRMACLMANHGQIALGTSLGMALAIAEEIEEQAAVYCGTLALGGPVLLDAAQMDEVLAMFARYGQTPRAAAPDGGEG